MAWLAVDKDGSEVKFNYKPTRVVDSWWSICGDNQRYMPQGSIQKLIGRSMSWKDEPVELE